MTTYNGYESWDHDQTWLWINNDQELYNLLMNKVELVVYMHITKTQAVYEMLRDLPNKHLMVLLGRLIPYLT
jgi:hypothetical protein